MASFAVAAEKAVPVKSGDVNKGTVADEIVFDQEQLPSYPIEVTLQATPNCHAFGFAAIDGRDSATPKVHGVIKRLVCKEDKGFRIWNVEGNVQNAAAPDQSLPVVAHEKGLAIPKDTPVTAQIDQISNERTGYHIYLYDLNLSYRPIKILLGELGSFKAPGEQDEQIEDLPELAN